MVLTDSHIARTRWPICKICRADMRETKEAKRAHLKDKHGFEFAAGGRGCKTYYFTAKEYLT